MLAILPKITEKVPVIQIFSNDYYSYVHAILSPIVISAGVKHVWMIFEIYLDRALINFQALRSTKYIVRYRKCKKRKVDRIFCKYSNTMYNDEPLCRKVYPCAMKSSK